MKQNKKPKQTLESAQYGLEINFKVQLHVPDVHPGQRPKVGCGSFIPKDRYSNREGLSGTLKRDG